MSNKHLVTQENSVALWDYFKEKYNLKIKQKRKSRIMKAAGWVLERLGYMTKNHFLDKVVTTVGRAIYIYKDLLTKTDFGAVLHALETAPHEVKHVKQKIKAWNYLLSKAKLAKYEVPAYSTNIEFHHFLTGEILDPVGLARRLRSYGIKEGSKEWDYAVETYKTVGRMAKKGMYKSDVVKEAIAFLENR